MNSSHGPAALVLAALALGIPLSGAARAATASPAGTAASTLACTEAAVRAAVAKGGTFSFDCNGDIALSSPLVISAGQSVTLSGTGHDVTLNGEHKSQIFLVDRGSLAVKALTLANGSVTGDGGSQGFAGANGAPGKGGTGGAVGASPAGNGVTGGSGTSGSPARNGTAGKAGAAGEGGALAIAAGARASLDDVTVTGSQAQGGDGGDGGAGGYGGSGGSGGGGGAGGASQPAGSPPPTGGDGFVSDPPIAVYPGGRGGGPVLCFMTKGDAEAGDGGTGGNGGNGANGGAGADGGKGGAGEGGAIYNAGTLAVTGSTFKDDEAVGGDGGDGGIGGVAGTPGSGGSGGYGGICTDSGTPPKSVAGHAGAGGNAGKPGSPGNGGSAGAGGAGEGGAIYSTGELTIASSSLAGDKALGGKGGDGAVSGQVSLGEGFTWDAGPWGAAVGGSSGSGIGPFKVGKTGTVAAPGVAGRGGNGGNATGGAIEAAGPLTLRSATFSADLAQAGGGGSGAGYSGGSYGGDGEGIGEGTPAYGTVGYDFLPDSGSGTATSGGQGANGTDGGAGGNGGSAGGGALYVTGSPAADSVQFSSCKAVGGGGGDGGDGATGGDGGYGGYGWSANQGSGTTVGSPPGNGGNGGGGGDGGSGGNGGMADGGAAFVTGTVAVSGDGLTFKTDSVLAGSKSAGGDGGTGGAGGAGGTINGYVGNGKPGKPGKSGLDGVDGPFGTSGKAADPDLHGTTAPPVTIITASLPAATVGTAYDTGLTAHGGIPPYAWSRVSGALPPGLTLSRTGRITGRPAKAGTWQFTVQVTDSSAGHLTASRKLSIRVR